MIRKIYSIVLLMCMVMFPAASLAQSRFVIYKWTGRHAKVGMIDSSGTVIVKPKLSDMSYPDFRTGPVPAKYGKKWGYIDENGIWVIDRKFDWARPFRNGLAKVKVGEKFGFINQAGGWVIPPQFNHAWPFYDELALVNAEVGGKIKYGYINKAGERVVDPIYDDASFFTMVGQQWLPITLMGQVRLG